MRPFAALVALLPFLAGLAQEPIRLVEAEVCIVGTTSGGVAAALQCRRLGLSVAMLGITDHLGGLTSGGLGATDVGNATTITGVAREFYLRIGQKYSQSTPRYNFEPKVARQVFQEMLNEAGVVPLYHRRPVGAVMQGGRLVRLLCDDQTQVRARVFIDATYEGDLMPLTGVSYTVGRESSALYGESLAGVRATNSGHQFPVFVDPYLTPGAPASGLLPFISPLPPGNPGDGDARVQAYNYRMCFTQSAANRLPHVQPPGYDPARYELLARYVEARVAAGLGTTLSAFFNISGMPNGKTDMNNNGPVSTDFIGMSYEYPDASYARRAELERDHLHYIQGLVWFLSTSPRVPLALRNEVNSWGPTRDEWVATGGYSPQIYVREARRMVSDYVVTQRDCQYTATAPDPVCLGSYNMDSHNCQRYVKNGQAWNEGDVQVGPAGPYGISYRALVPRAGQCDNLLVTFALSASHVAFGSTRMEPVFMMCSHAAADAAAIAAREDLGLLAVPYARLAAQLASEGLMTTWGATGGGGVIVDNPEAQLTGTWSLSTSKAGFYGANYAHDGNVEKGLKSALYRPNLPASGEYDVYLRWTTDPNRAPAVPVDIQADAGLTTHTVNMLNDNGVWMLLRRAFFSAGTNGFLRIRTDGATGFVIADAARWVSITPEPVRIHALAVDPEAAETPGNPGRLRIFRDPASDPAPAITVPLVLGGTASNGVDYAAWPSSVSLPANGVSTDLVLNAVADLEVEGVETVMVTVGSGAGVVPAANASATLRILDPPYDRWRHGRFGAQAQDGAVSGRLADPDGDGISNEKEYAFGLNPLLAEPQELPEFRWEEGRLTARVTRNRLAADLRLAPLGAEGLSAWTWRSDLVTTAQVQEVSAEADRVTLRLNLPPPAASAGALRLDLQPAP